MMGSFLLKLLLVVVLFIATKSKTGHTLVLSVWCCYDGNDYVGFVARIVEAFGTLDWKGH